MSVEQRVPFSRLTSPENGESLDEISEVVERTITAIATGKPIAGPDMVAIASYDISLAQSVLNLIDGTRDSLPDTVAEFSDMFVLELEPDRERFFGCIDGPNSLMDNHIANHAKTLEH